MRTQNASNLLSFPTRIEEPARSNSKCPACARLENEYQCAIHEISSVVKRRFPAPGQKLRELHKWQDTRDGALKAFYEHKASHTLAARSDPRAQKTGGSASNSVVERIIRTIDETFGN
jgi:hypothetical protein